MKNGHHQTTTEPTNDFLQTFFEVDKNKEEVITSNQIKNYSGFSKWNNDIVQKWTYLFKLTNNDRITLENVCDYLRLNIKDVRKQRDVQVVKPEKSQISNNNNELLGSDIEVIIDQMPMNMKISIVSEFRKLVSNKNGFDEKIATEYMKNFMDKQFSSSWIVLIVKGSYSATFVHFEDCSLQFRLNNYNFIVWRIFMGFH
ncbi:unnamed protein product [Heterobilharzia americana]|nr:unnamed protein product [Heterobilharzia americana]